MKQLNFSGLGTYNFDIREGEFISFKVIRGDIEDYEIIPKRISSDMSLYKKLNGKSVYLNAGESIPIGNYLFTIE